MAKTFSPFFDFCLASSPILSILLRLKHAYKILETSDDNREKLQAMELFKDTHLVKLELLSNATTIDSALNYIRNKQQDQKKKGQDSNSTSNDNLDDDQLTKAEGRQTIF